MGRFGDDCARVIVKKKEIVDLNLNAAKNSIFSKFAESCIAPKSKQQKKRNDKAVGKVQNKSAT